MNVSYLLDMFPPETRALPNFMGLAEAILTQCVDLESCIDDISGAFSFDDAAGVQLDVMGELLGIKRPAAASDADYRSLIERTLAIWQWDGTLKKAREIVASLYNGTLTDNSQLGSGHGGETRINLPAGSDEPPRELLPVPAGVFVTVNIAS